MEEKTCTAKHPNTGIREKIGDGRTSSEQGRRWDRILNGIALMGSELMGSSQGEGEIQGLLWDKCRYDPSIGWGSQTAEAKERGRSGGVCEGHGRHRKGCHEVESEGREARDAGGRGTQEVSVQATSEVK